MSSWLETIFELFVATFLVLFIALFIVLLLGLVGVIDLTETTTVTVTGGHR